MTIREHLDRLERPYKRDSAVCIALFIMGAVAMLASLETNATALVDGEFGWNFGASLAAGLLYLAGGLGAVASAILQFLSVRCPQCNGRLRSRTKHWRHCPLCGVNFDTQIPNKNKENQSSQQ